MRQGSGKSGTRNGRSGARQGFRTRDDRPTPGRPAARPGKASGGPKRDFQDGAEERKRPRPEAGAPGRDAPPRARRRAEGEGIGRDDPARRPNEPPKPTKRAQKEAAQEALATGVQTLTVEPDEADMRVDRFLTARFPQLAFTHVQRIVRKGELRVDGKRVQPNDRLAAGAKVRIPPLKLDQPRPRSRDAEKDQGDREFLKSITLYEDKDVLVLNKPMGLAVQGGSGMKRHVDGLLEALRDDEGQKPRLVHRLDKDTAGCLVIAKTRFAATTLAKSFRSRSARKIYWALVAGVPRVKQGRISTYLSKEEMEEDSRMRVAQHGEEGASHALTYYAVIDTAAQKLAWVSLKPVTGRTHQLRAHAAHIGHPIVGDPKYFNIENWQLPGGIQNRLHLLARRIVLPHPRTGKPIDITAPLPSHMQQSFNLLGFETDRYDPIVEAPEE